MLYLPSRKVRHEAEKDKLHSSANKVVLLCSQGTHLLNHEGELDSRSESVDDARKFCSSPICGWCKKILFFPFSLASWIHKRKRKVSCPLWKGHLQVSKTDRSSVRILMKHLGTKTKTAIVTVYFKLWLLLISVHPQLDSFNGTT